MKCLILMINCVAYDIINLFNLFNTSKLELSQKTFAVFIMISTKLGKMKDQSY